MSNHCENHLVISTSLVPSFFLDKDEDGELKFDCLEMIMPFDKDWGTKWVNVYSTEVSEDIDLPRPPEPTPIIITQGSRRYPVKQKPDFIPYTYKIITAGFTSAWAPPTGYYESLYNFLRKVDPRSTLHAKYYEPGAGFLGEWINGIEVTEDTPHISWSETLSKEVMITPFTDFHTHILEDFLDMSELIPLEEAISELLAIGTPEALEEIEELKSYT